MQIARRAFKCHAGKLDMHCNMGIETGGRSDALVRWLLIGGVSVLSLLAITVLATPMTPGPTVVRARIADDRAVSPPAGMIYECRRAGQRVLSDQPCGADATLRPIETDRYSSYSPPPASAPVNASAGAATRKQSVAVTRRATAPDQRIEKKLQCELLEAQIARLDSIMRAGYSVRAGERLRSKRAVLKQQYYDTRCGR